MNDILTDGNGDLLIKDGDFVFGPSSLQHQKHILLAQKGEFKQHPQVGVGIKNLYDEENPKKILLEIKRQFEADGLDVKNVKLEATGKLIIDAKYR